MAGTRTRHGREPPVQASSGQRQICHRQRLRLLPNCELPGLGTPCRQPPRVLSSGEGCVCTSRPPSSATSPPPPQPQTLAWPLAGCVTPGVTTVGTQVTPLRERSKCSVLQGCSGVKSARVMPWGPCWPVARVQTTGCSTEGRHCHCRLGLGLRRMPCRLAPRGQGPLRREEFPRPAFQARVHTRVTAHTHPRTRRHCVRSAPSHTTDT